MVELDFFWLVVIAGECFKSTGTIFNERIELVHTGENSETRCEGRMQEGEVGIGDPRSTNGVETILVYTERYAPNAYNL